MRLQPYFAAQSASPPRHDVVGTGMRLNMADINGDGRPDVVVACRTGLYVFLNKGYSTRSREKGPLPDRDSYPGNINWDAPRPVAPAGRAPRQPAADSSVSDHDGQ
jgi:hypothetical protein